jgi:hypothetical protein
MSRVSKLVLLTTLLVYAGPCTGQSTGTSVGIVYCSNPKQAAPCNTNACASCCRDNETQAICDLVTGKGGEWSISKCGPGEICQSWYNSEAEYLGDLCDSTGNSE